MTLLSCVTCAHRHNTLKLCLSLLGMLPAGTALGQPCQAAPKPSGEAPGQSVDRKHYDTQILLRDVDRRKFVVWSRRTVKTDFNPLKHLIVSGDVEVTTGTAAQIKVTGAQVTIDETRIRGHMCDVRIRILHGRIVGDPGVPGLTPKPLKHGKSGTP